MIAFVQKQFDFDLIKRSLTTAIIYYLLFNTPVLIVNFSVDKNSLLHILTSQFQELSYTLFVIFLIFFGLSIYPLIFSIGSMILFTTGAIASFNLYYFNRYVTVNNLKQFFNSDIDQIFQMFSFKLLLWLIFSLCVCIYTISYKKIKESKTLVNNLAVIFSLFCSINLIISPNLILTKIFPIQYLHVFYNYLTL